MILPTFIGIKKSRPHARAADVQPDCTAAATLAEMIAIEGTLTIIFLNVTECKVPCALPDSADHTVFTVLMHIATTAFRKLSIAVAKLAKAVLCR